ncbi:hypothetical protein HO173_009346 [Letharia columbiana]|uniref:Major facilitator superfamily (MFS) profile domain-containing protein n=1 Tax=Letharia columbiana TaxID=112416 RepID=A0A8H6FPT5_9LECA|nr:uncharacterized protein HO173_009346 [Letharia columbiana]KAF6232466.1 hypothetical protein HO173_009346 [Letharia columbiana]
MEPAKDEASASQAPPSLEEGRHKASPKPQATITDWDGPDDAGNPQNWGSAKKIYATMVPALYAFTVLLGASVYTPGISQISSKFDVSRTAAVLGFSLFAEGLAFGPMIGAPISETFGRRAIYLISLPVSILFTMATGLAKNFATILVCRFLAGTFGAPAVAVGAGTIADIWNLQRGAGGLATILFVLAPFAGSAIGPLIGGYTIDTRKDWQWLMWVLILVAGPVWLMALVVSETSKKELLRRRAIARGHTPPPKPPTTAFLKALFVITLFRPLRMLIIEPIVSSLSLYVSFVFGVMFAFFDAYPYVFQSVYAFSLGQVGLAFVSIVIGFLFAALTSIVINKTLFEKSRKEAGPGILPPPEKRLYVSMVGSVGIPVSLFWFAWTAKASIHWIVPILAGIPFGWGNVCLFLGTTTYLIDTYKAQYSASALAANGLLRYTFGAIFPLFTFQMYSRLGIAWAGSLLGFISILLLPIPWVLYKWGSNLRSRSSYKV